MGLRDFWAPESSGGEQQTWHFYGVPLPGTIGQHRAVGTVSPYRAPLHSGQAQRASTGIPTQYQEHSARLYSTRLYGTAVLV